MSIYLRERQAVLDRLVEQTKEVLHDPDVAAVLGGYALELDSLTDNLILPAVSDEGILVPPKGEEFNDKVAVFPLLSEEDNTLVECSPLLLLRQEPRGIKRMLPLPTSAHVMRDRAAAHTHINRFAGMPTRPVIVTGSLSRQSPLTAGMGFSHELGHANETMKDVRPHRHEVARQELQMYHMNLLQRDALLAAGRITQVDDPLFDWAIDTVNDIRVRHAAPDVPYNGRDARSDLEAHGII